MCGIAAILQHSDNIAIRHMVSAMHHRGPDDHGVWSRENIHLGMARLSIIDLSPAGHQPMMTEDGRFVIVFNGEVYNFQELRKQFLSNDAFCSDTDTEVVLRLFRKMGVNCLKYLRGMFAFLIWDCQEKTLWGARDRLGIKPFWYYQKGSSFIAASEIKAMLASELIPFEQEPKAIRQLMLYGSVQFPYSFIKGVFSLPPASWFCFRDGEMTTGTYWHFPQEADEGYTIEKAVAEFKEVFTESLRLRLISDRTAGVFLSSGLDSVSLLAGLKNIAGPRIRTFTVGFDTPHAKFKSEAGQAAEISRHFGFANDSVMIGAKEAASNFDQFIKGLDQPSIDGLNTYLVSKYSKDYLTVALSGLGGDELMLGYPRNINLYNQLQRRPQLPKWLVETYLKKRAEKKGWSNRYVNALLQRTSGSADLRLLYWANRLINPPWLVDQMTETRNSVEEDIASFFAFDPGYKSNLFNRISYYEMRTYMLSQLLRDMDAVSMSHSIEVRFPLIDHKLVEFMFRLPARLKYNPPNHRTDHRTGKTTYASSGIKHLLAETFKRELPDGYLNTPKQGFQLPYLEWVAKSRKNEIISVLEEQLNSLGLINPVFLREFWAGIKKGSLPNNAYLIYIWAEWQKAMQGLMEPTPSTDKIS